jgi:hypothetical protein
LRWDEFEFERADEAVRGRARTRPVRRPSSPPAEASENAPRARPALWTLPRCPAAVEESGTKVTRSGEAALALDAALPPERPLPSRIASWVHRVGRPPRMAGIRLRRRVRRLTVQPPAPAKVNGSPNHFGTHFFIASSSLERRFHGQPSSICRREVGDPRHRGRVLEDLLTARPGMPSFAQIDRVPNGGHGGTCHTRVCRAGC